MSYDDLGDRMKDAERIETSRRFDPKLPIYARIDGRGFSRFTKGMARPFDIRMTNAMIDTAKFLVAGTNARIGYTQSDEISLVWMLTGENPLEQMMFDGKSQKLVSILAGMATAAFTRVLARSSDPTFAAYADRLPHFDARVFSLPNRTEAANALLWRELDAARNAVQMTGHSLFSHTRLQGVGVVEMLRMTAEAGVDFEQYPTAFKRGTYLRRELRERLLTEEQRLAIPLAHRPAAGETVIRGDVDVIDMPSFRTVGNREAVIFDGEDPVAKEPEPVFDIAVSA